MPIEEQPVGTKKLRLRKGSKMKLEISPRKHDRWWRISSKLYQQISRCSWVSANGASTSWVSQVEHQIQVKKKKMKSYKVTKRKRK